MSVDPQSMWHFKVMVIGTVRVGKSSLVHQYCTEEPFNPQYRTTAGVIPFDAKDLVPMRGEYSVQVWDSTGKDRLKLLTTSYFSSMHGFLLVFDMTSRESFRKAKGGEWLEKDVNSRASTHAQVLLVGNKADRGAERQVSGQEAAQYAKDSALIGYVESSAHMEITTANQPFAVLIRAMADYYGDLPGGKPVDLNRKCPEMPTKYFPLKTRAEIEKTENQKCSLQ